jgi:hypothetical protein
MLLNSLGTYFPTHRPYLCICIPFHNNMLEYPTLPLVVNSKNKTNDVIYN